jgi:hypothetical protein
MTDQEFSNWVRNIRSRFAHVGKFLDAMNLDDRKQTTVYWFEQVKFFDVDHANAALDSMFNAAKRIFAADWFQAFMVEIRKVKAERDRMSRSNYHDGERLSDCRFNCTIEGFVFIECRGVPAVRYNARVLFKIKDDDQIPGEIIENIAKRFPVAVACSCGKGESLAGHGLRRLRPHSDVIHGRSAPVTPHWSTQKEMAAADNPF